MLLDYVEYNMKAVVSIQYFFYSYIRNNHLYQKSYRKTNFQVQHCKQTFFFVIFCRCKYASSNLSIFKLYRVFFLKLHVQLCVTTPILNMAVKYFWLKCCKAKVS